MTATGRFEFDSREYYRALRAMWRSNPARPFLPLVAVVIPGAAIWLSVVRNWDRLTPMGVVLNGLPWVLLSAFYITLIPMMLRAGARKATQNEPSLRGPQVRTVSDEGVEITGANFLQRLSWSD